MPVVRTFSIIGIAGIVFGVLFFVLYFKGSSVKKEKLSVAPAGDAAAVTGETQPASYDSDIVINGVKYMRSDFEIVNEKIQAGDIDGAVNAVRDRTGYGEEEAREVVNNWGKYYN